MKVSDVQKRKRQAISNLPIFLRLPRVHLLYLSNHYGEIRARSLYILSNLYSLLTLLLYTHLNRESLGLYQDRLWFHSNTRKGPEDSSSILLLLLDHLLNPVAQLQQCCLSKQIWSFLCKFKKSFYLPVDRGSLTGLTTLLSLITASVEQTIMIKS